MSLFSLLKNITSEKVVAQIAELTQEKPTNIQKAFDVSAVGLVGSLIKRVGSETGMKLVHDQISKITFDDNDLTNSLKSTDGLAQLAAQGDKILNTILPNVKSSVIGLISKTTSMRNSKSSILCTVSTLLITSTLRNQIKTQNLSPESLASYLGDQREGLLEVSPADNANIIEATGIGHLLTNFSVSQNTTPKDVVVTDTTPATKDDSQTPFLNNNDYEKTATNYAPVFKWIGVGLGAVALVVGGLYVWNNIKSTTTDNTDSTEIAQNEARIIVEPADTSANKVPDTTTTPEPLPAVATPTTNPNPMQVYLADTTKAKGRTFRFDNVDFEDNSLKSKPEVSTAIGGLVGLLKKYPTAEVRFIVYANDAQLPLTNKMLAIKRAYELKNLMINGGISFVRIDTEARGNGTESKISPSPKPLREVYVKFVKK